MRKCPECGGSGFIIKVDKETGEEKGYPCKCRLAREEVDLMRKRLISADIPNKYWDYTLENYKTIPVDSSIHAANKKSIETLEKFIENPSLFLDNFNVLWIWGKDHIAGHTTLATIFATELLKKGKRVKFLLMQNFLDAFTNFDEKNEFFSKLDNVDVYIIDNAFLPSACTTTGDYTIIHFYNWMLDVLSHNKHIICTAKSRLEEIDIAFDKFKYLISKYYLPLEFQGSFSKTLDMQRRALWQK